MNVEDVGRLPLRLTEPLALVVQEGCTYREVAARLGLAPAVVAGRLREALHAIREGGG